MDIESYDAVIGEYYPALLPTVHACLSVFGAMSFAERTKPLALILEARSGFGKTAAVQMFVPSTDSPFSAYVYRSDDFSPKSFVSHHANKKGPELSRIDLLPRIENKVLITKELAPLFRGREEHMQENFSKLISVLDGKGFTSDSGSHGQRGYQHDILFNWIGCTTPLPPSVHALMSQLGTRLLFWEAPSVEPTEEELVQYLMEGRSKEAEIACQVETETYLMDFFHQFPIGSYSPSQISISQAQYQEIVRWAQFLCAARAEIHSEKNGTNWEAVSAGASEGPWKVTSYFRDLAYGHALVTGREYIDSSDLRVVAHTAISSVPAHLRPIIHELRKGGVVSSAIVQEICRVSEPTAINYIRQVVLLRIGQRTHKAGYNVTLSPAYEWMTV